MKTENPQQHLQDKTEVLIALAAQKSETVEQTPSPEELNDFFANSRRFSKQRQAEILAHLDSCPQAYERWIKQGKKAEQSSSARFVFSIMSYAMTTAAVFLVIGVVLLWRGQAFELDRAIDRAYQVAVFSDNSENFRDVAESLNDMLQQNEHLLSFSQTGQMSQLAQVFMLGLKHDWQVLEKEQTSDNNDPIGAQQEDYQLGRWYILLWTVSQQNKVLTTDFWQKQLEILDHFQTYYARLALEMDVAEIRSITLQLERMQTILQQLAKTSQTVELYRQLEQILTALRYSLILS